VAKKLEKNLSLKTNTTLEISEAKIRNIPYMLRNKKTKKACCEYLGISYNTKRLDKLVEDFLAKEKRTEELKKKASKAPISQEVKKDIINSYLGGEAQTKIGERYYISASRVKKVLIEGNIPLRGRGKKSAAKIAHVIEDLNIPFSIGDKVYIPGEDPDNFVDSNKAKVQLVNVYGTIEKVYDEEYVEELSEGHSKTIYIESVPIPEGQEAREGVHYENYWILPTGKTWGKLRPFQHHVNTIENTLAETGREFYKVWIEDGLKRGFYTITREKLLTIPTV
jgi:hypothetical protein